MNEKKHMPKWFLRPTQLELSILYILLGVFVFTATDSLIYHPCYGFVLVALCLTEMLFFLRLCSFAFAVRADVAREAVSRWVQLAVIGMLVLIIFGTNLGLSVRFRLSEEEFLPLVTAALAAPPEECEKIIAAHARPIGLFMVRIDKIDKSSNTVWFHTAMGGEAFPPPYGFNGGVLYTKQMPPDRSETTYQHLYGPWWLWVQDI